MKKYNILFLLFFIPFILPIPIQAETVYVSGEVVNIRSGPNTRHQVVRKVERNEALKRIKRLNGWSRVVLPDGETGWISEYYISSEKTPAKGEAVYVTGQTVNIRSGPGIRHRILAEVKKGAELKRIKRSDGWSRVVLPDGERGWISEHYITTHLDKKADSDDVLQFRSFRLGSLKAEIIQQLQDGGYSYQSEKAEIHASISELFGHECQVDFRFTPKSMTLYMIELFWPHIDISERAKHVLIYKYGKPHRVHIRTGDLFWIDGDISVQLDADINETRIYYTHSKLFALFQKEGRM